MGTITNLSILRDGIPTIIYPGDYRVEIEDETGEKHKVIQTSTELDCIAQLNRGLDDMPDPDTCLVYGCTPAAIELLDKLYGGTEG